MPPLSIRPSGVLAPFVAGLHYHESDGPTSLERILPGGRVHLLVNLHENEFRTYHGPSNRTICRTHGAVFQAPAPVARVIDTALQRRLVSVDFTPGGAAAFFGMPLREANGELVELDRLWGADGASLRDRLLEAETPVQQLALVEKILRTKLASRAAVDPIIAPAVAMLERGMRVAKVAAALGVLPRTLMRRFDAAIGLGPKRFARMRRLQRVVRAVSHAREIDWCDVALTHGFVDQSHLVHDFRELAGLPPTAYRPRSAHEPNHVPVAT